jgi:hypothetical protein
MTRRKKTRTHGGPTAPTAVRVSKPASSVTDGPFAETKEMFGGPALLEPSSKAGVLTTRRGQPE